MRKGSDINVGNIEEDIKIVKELLKGAKDYGQYNGNKYFHSIENILQDYTRQEQINEQHQNINGELREKVKELEEENMQKDLEIIGKEEYTEANMKEIISQYYTANEDCIQKQKIKDKIEELKRQRRELGFKTYLKKEDIINDDREIVCKIQGLQELLQESEDK